jgi:diacylglycerol O-acyltransferase
VLTADILRFQNVVSGSYAYFPMEDMSTRSLIKSIHQQMNLFKIDFIPYLLYFLANIFLLIPGVLPSWLIAYEVQKIHGVFTNVPGPRKAIHFAGQEIKDYRVLPPQNSKGGVGMGLVSYNDKVALAILGDEAEAYPGAMNAICQNFKPVFNKMLLEAQQILDAKAKKLHEN